MSSFSLNNQLVLERYKNDKTMRAVERNGFATVSQKVTVVGLKVLVEAHLNNGTKIAKGSLAYIKEELLFTQHWAKQALQSNAIEGEFMIVDAMHVSFIIPQEPINLDVNTVNLNVPTPMDLNTKTIS